MPMRPRLTVTPGNAVGSLNSGASDSSGPVLTALVSPMPSCYTEQQSEQKGAPSECGIDLQRYQAFRSGKRLLVAFAVAFVRKRQRQLEILDA